MNHDIKLQRTHNFLSTIYSLWAHIGNEWLRNCPYVVVALTLMLHSPVSRGAELKRTQYWSILLTNMAAHGVACCTEAGVRSSTTGVEAECFLHRGQNKRVVCYVSVSLVLLPAMHNECPRHALSIEFEYKLTRVSLTWLPRTGP